MRVIVVGANRGLGLVLVKLLLSNGHNVAAGYRQTPSQELQNLKQEYHAQLLLYTCDVTDEAEVINSVELLRQFELKYDAVCNVAGVLLDSDRMNQIHECDISDFRKTFEVNVIGAVIVAKYYTPLIEQDGLMLTITSEGTGIKQCGSWVPAYALSKTAATKMSGIFNVSNSNINYYSVHPGRMNTDMGRTTAQIEPEVAAEGIYKLISGETNLTRAQWYIDYNGVGMNV